jgi:hypothetical protein
MKDLPNAAWAAYFITIASILVLVLVYAPGPENLKLAVLGFGSNIVTGAFAYIQGKKDATSVTVPSQPSPGTATTVNIGPDAPAAPAKPEPPPVLPQKEIV